MNRTLGADIGYSSGKKSSNLNTPPSKGDPSGPVYMTLDIQMISLLQILMKLLSLTGNNNMKVTSVLFIRDCTDAWNWFGHQTLCFLLVKSSEDDYLYKHGIPIINSVWKEHVNSQ
jgi:hypothetical protein